MSTPIRHHVIPMSAAIPGPLVLLVTMFLQHPAHADWPADPRASLPICTASGPQQMPDIARDDSGGAIIVWEDLRGSDWDIYAQHVLATGGPDPAWPAGGRSICPALGDQRRPRLVADGRGGAVIAWEDRRGDRWQVYAQHMLPSGESDPAWPTEGRLVCLADSNQIRPIPLSDGAGGAIVTWLDAAFWGRQTRPMSQHVLASGSVDPAWPVDGRVLADSGHPDTLPPPNVSGPIWDRWDSSDDLGPRHDRTAGMVGDAFGGIIVVWRDEYRGAEEVRAQHILPDGRPDPDWPSGGQRVLAGITGLHTPLIVTDGAHGAIVTWATGNLPSESVYAQHVLSNGSLDAAWPARGCLVTPDADDYSIGQALADGSGGILIAWHIVRRTDKRYAGIQHVLSGGIVDPAWPREGRHVDADVLVGDGAGGTLAVRCHEKESPHLSFKSLVYITDEDDVRAQHVLGNGGLDPAWPKGDLAVSTAKGRQFRPAAIEDGAGGVIIVWDDWRAHDCSNDEKWRELRQGIDWSTHGYYLGDIYAQRVGPDGKLGGTVMMKR